MEVVRWLHRDRFDQRQNRFNRVAFRNSGIDGGISVSECDCVHRIGYATGSEICEHAREAYLKRGIRAVSDPPIYWKFDSSILPEGNQITPDPTDFDPCHSNITGVSDDACSALLKSKSLSDFMICDENGPRALLRSDLP